jgi:hypothetical protein
MGLFPRAKPKICDKCGESYPSLTKFNAHRATCKKHKCTKCDLRFATGPELKEHAGTHRVRFHCDECETEPFQSQGALEYHKKAAHDGVIKCPHCDKTFSRADHRDEHVKNKHDTEKANKCACGTTYVKKWQLERHEQECVVSPIGAANAVKRKYAELVSGDDEMREKSVTIPATLALKVFDMVREAAQKKIRKGEESRSTTDSVIERVCCETCGAPYGNRESLKRHMRKKHPRASGSGNENA